MNHREAELLLDAWLDGELDPATTGLLQAHVEDCSLCAAHVTQRRRLSAQLRAAPLRRLPPPQLRTRIVADARTRKTSKYNRPSWSVALAAGVLVAVAGLIVGRTLPRPVDITTELADAHARSVLSSQALEVASSDHHTVKPWLSGHLPFSPPVPATLGIDDELLGGRVDVINRQPVAALVYRHGQHRVDVFVWPSASMPGTPTVRPTTDGYGLAEAAAGEFRAVFVSDMSPAEMARFVDAWRAASAPR